MMHKKTRRNVAFFSASRLTAWFEIHIEEGSGIHDTRGPKSGATRKPHPVTAEISAKDEFTATELFSF